MALPNPEYDDELESLEPVHSYLAEVRDLFRANIVTELEVDHEDCDVLGAKAAGRSSPFDRCECPTVAYYYVGRRADRELGIPAERIAGPCLSLAELERLCKDRISHFRRLAREQKAGQ